MESTAHAEAEVVTYAGKTFLVSFGEDAFTVYDANGAILGTTPHPWLASAIVAASAQR